MLLTLRELRDQPSVRGLLSVYAEQKKSQPDAEWNDRVMEFEGASESDLRKWHGLLLASGWIETRVHSEAFRTAGKLESCYRITPDGLAALRFSGKAS